MEGDNNPGVDSSTGNIVPSTWSSGTSIELYESLLDGNMVLGARHDVNNDGYRTVTVGNTLNLGMNIPGFKYAHLYLESRLGGSSSLAGATNGPEWKGMLWLTLPLPARGVKWEP